MRWLSVVTLAIGLLVATPGPAALAQESSPSSAPSPATTPAPGRFVLREGGYAVTFPEGWEVLVLRCPWAQAVCAAEMPVDWSPIPIVRAEEGHDGEVSELVAFCEIKVWAPCAGPCATLIDEAAAREVAWFESGTDVPVPSTVESVVLTLPAGHAVRVRTAYTDLESDRSIYYLTDGRAVATLLCMAKDDPEDHWLSVAESFEFLPAEE